MNFESKNLTQLDYYRIRGDIAGCCKSADGKALVEAREPLTDEAEINRLKAEAAQWEQYINRVGEVPLTAWEPLEGIFSLLSVTDAALELEELHFLGSFCRITATTLESLKKHGIEIPIPNLVHYAETIPDISQVATLIHKVIDNNGQLRDLPQLREIRASIAKIRKDIEATIHAYTAKEEFRDVLQSSLPALRSDRQVLAVKSGSRNKIKGIIHEVSQTGQTVYIEPEDVVRKNNELIQEEFRLNAEIRRILKELTKNIAPYKDDLQQAHSAMTQLDAAYGTARWGIHCKGIYADNCLAGQEPVLLQARHPLLGSKAVPIDLVFPPGCRVLIITGPNTGGKTVTLKTLALFTLLNQSGFPVPAAEGTRLPISSGVFADIGDEQSLDQSLSTFSGHMKNIAHMVEASDRNSLLLLDELGSGTDPQEGGAIAMAVLDSLIQKETLVVVTTHHGVLKNYGYTHPSCTNASAEFDENTLAPTYRIKTGIPGESRALDIAKRNGLPTSIVDQAAAYLAGEQADVSAMIRSLTAKHEEADKFMLQLKEQQAQIWEKQRRADLKELRLRQKELELSQRDLKQEREFLRESRKKLENLVRELREGEISKEKTLAVKQFINQTEEIIAKNQTLLEEDTETLLQDNLKAEETYGSEQSSVLVKRKGKKRLKNKDALALAQSDTSRIQNISQTSLHFEEGATVLTKPGNRTGTLIRKTGKKTWLVQVGSLKLTMKEKELQCIPTRQLQPSVSVELVSQEDYTQPGVVFYNDTSATQTKAVLELRLLGMRYEEAMKALERQLDLASIQGLSDFSVIHGKGNGILQQAVQDYLSHYPGVESFSFAPPEEGGTGKTYVHLVKN